LNLIQKLKRNQHGGALDIIPIIRLAGQVFLFNHWDAIKPDPWTYTADHSDIALKQNALKAQIYQSERYRNLREQVLGPELL